MVVSSGENGIEIMDEFRWRIVAADVTEDLLRENVVVRGRRGGFGVDGVVGVSIGDCCWSCILNGAFVF